jgi:CubicO group peptidase (beta-lactamase class C family)|tara:strand:- start:538 stop:1848 length:1311 start_codon:yes stop_codon:yes gene_type:complete
MYRLIILLVLLFPCTNICAQGWTVKLDSVLTISAKDNLFDGQVLIAEKGKVEFNKAYGFSKKGEVITPNSALSIASVSKAITALSILILQDRGLLNINQKITEYIPELPYNEVSIKNLLNMTSGLPRFQPTVEKHGDTTKTYSANELIKLISKHKPQASDPGVSFGYNNDNYLLLAVIIEKVTGEPFAKFVQTNIFNPLGMNNSYIYKKIADNDYSSLSSNAGPALGAGHMQSTAYNLYLFEQALYGNKLLSQDLIEKSFKYRRLKDGSLSNYGFAWRLHKDDIVNEVYIIGDGEDIRASVQRFTYQNKTLIYIHNKSGSNWKKVYNAVRNIWEGKPFEMPQKRIVYDIDTNLYQKYVGKYLSKPFGLLHITVENNKLYLRPDPIPGKEELVPSSDTTFFFSEQALEWEFFLDENGEVIGLGLKGNKETMGPKQID